jgi:hypothetical protein
MYRFAAGLTILLAGCADLDFDPSATWRADLVPTTEAAVSGTLGAETQGSGTFATGIVMVGAPATRYAWEVAAGSCDARGPRMGGAAAYPDLVTTGPTEENPNPTEGSAQVTRTVVNVSLLPRGRYHARILDGEDRTTVLACGNLVRLTG